MLVIGEEVTEIVEIDLDVGMGGVELSAEEETDIGAEGADTDEMGVEDSDSDSGSALLGGD